MKFKKNLKKISFVLFAVAMQMMLCATAFAADPTGSLTLKGEDGTPKTTSEFTAYQLVTWNAEEIASGNMVYTNMQVASNFTSFFTGTYALDAISDFTFNSSESIALSNALENYIDTNAISGYATTTTGVFDALPHGYYLVLETESNSTDPTVATKPILVGVPSNTGETNVAVTVKSATADINKVIVKNSTDYTTSTEDIGDTVSYRVDSNIPTYGDNATDITYRVNDTMSKGLTFNGTDSMQIYGVASDGAKTLLTKDIDYTVTTTPNPVVAGTETTIQIDFVYANIKNYISVSSAYSATLNLYANIGSAGNPNTVNLTYTNNPNSGSTYTTIDHRVITYTYGIAIKKLDESQNDLQGAVFALENAQGNAIVTYTYDATGKAIIINNDTTYGYSAITDDTGWTYFVGMDAGTYYIHELKAPEGYNLLKNRVEVQIVAAMETVSINGTSVSQPSGQWNYIVDGTTISTTDYDHYVVDQSDGTLKLMAKVDVTNTAGFTLPGTGGSGTRLFTIVGLLLIVAASITFVIYTKKKKVEHNA